MKTQLFIAVLFFLYLICPASALSIDSTKINIAEDKNANVYFHYSLIWWEQIYYKYLAGISGGEKQLIETKFSEILDKKVEIKNLDTEYNDVSLIVFDFIAEKKDFKDGYWISYAGILPTGDIFTIKDVTIIYPDGYIKTYDGNIPSDVHFVNNNLARYNYRAQYYQNLYNESYESYDPNTYKINSILNIVGEMLTKTGYYDFLIKNGVRPIAISGFPEYVQWIDSLKGNIETITTGEPYKSLANLKNDKTLLENVMSDSAFVGYMSDNMEDSGKTRKKISVDMKKLSELKLQEVSLLERLTSEPKEWVATSDSLIANLHDQKSTLSTLIEASKTMIKDVKIHKESGVPLSDNSFVYLESISGLAEQISENDLKNVNEELEYLTKL